MPNAAAALFCISKRTSGAYLENAEFTPSRSKGTMVKNWLEPWVS